MDPVKLLRTTLTCLIAIPVLLMPARTAAAQDVPDLPGQFVYVEDGSRLVLVRGNVQEPVLLVQTEGRRVVENPHFSRDGRYLAYCIHDPEVEEYPHLYYLDTLTLEKVEVTTEGSCSYDWWQDGRTLVFSTPVFLEKETQPDPGIWSYSPETGALEVLVRTGVPVVDPRGSPDGRTLSYFDFCFECVGQFHTYDLISGVTMDWSQADRTVGPDVDWSPDGRSLAFDKALWMYAGAGETHGLELASSDAQTWEEIYSQDGHGAYFPIWSPKGKEIAFASFESFTIGTYVNRRADLMTVSPDGTAARTIYASTYEIFPQAWSPDGRYMLVVEPLSVAGDAMQKQQLVLVDMQSGSVLWKKPSFGRLTAGWAPVPAQAAPAAQPPASIAGQDGLLFIGPDHALAFYEPLSGRTQKLSGSFSGSEFSLSPDGKTILFGGRILSLQGQADGSVSVSGVETDLPASFSSLSWSPDSQKFGYVEGDGSAWEVDLLGSRTQLSDGRFPPEWSHDGQWMAYCDGQGRLWIAQTGKPADWIIQKDNCSAEWSPTQSILAYVTYPSGGAVDRADGTAFLYDPVSGQTKEIAQAMSGMDWSPDGKLISIGRVTAVAAGSYSYSITVVNPETGAELFIDEYSSEAYANDTWIGQENGYLFGRYRFQADLLAKEQAAEILFDATRDGNRLLTASGGPQALDIRCQDLAVNATHLLLSATLSDTPGAAMPGLSGRFSPDGNWILIGDYVQDRTINRLARCDGSAPVQLAKNAWLFDQYFSPDSAWLVMEQTQPGLETIPQIYVQELQSGTVREIQAGLDTRSAWFQMPEAPAAPPAASVTVPGASPAPIEAGGPIHLQNDSPVVSDSITLLSILLWASALVAILVLMLHLWRRSQAPRKGSVPAAQDPPVEEQQAAVPASGGKPAPEEARAAFQRGVDHVRAGRAGEGIAELGKVIAAEPENNMAWFWLGIASVRQEDRRAAERCFLQAKRYGHPEADKALDWLKKQKK